MALSFVAASVVRDGYLNSCPFPLNYVNFTTASLDSVVTQEVIIHDLPTLRLAMLAAIANADEEELRSSMTYLANLGLDNIHDTATIIYIETLVLVNRESLRISGKTEEAARLDTLSFLEGLEEVLINATMCILPSFSTRNLPTQVSRNTWAVFMQSQYGEDCSFTLSDGFQSSTMVLNKSEFTEEMDSLLMSWWVMANEWSDSLVKDTDKTIIRDTLLGLTWDSVTQTSFRQFIDGIDFSEPSEYREFAIWILTGLGFKEVDWPYRANCIIESGLLLVK